MRCTTRLLTCGAILAVMLGSATAVRAEDSSQPNKYIVNSLVSDIDGVAPNTDPILQNAWGVAFTPAASPFWVADNATGCATLYDGIGAKQTLEVRIPLPGGTLPTNHCEHVNPKSPPSQTPAAPTGIVWNPTTNVATAFLVPGTQLPASFIFATEDGTISAWANGLMPSDAAVIAVDNSDKQAVYKGLVFGTNADGVFLFATNFRAGTVEVFDHEYKPVTKTGAFEDSSIPAGFAPFNIANIDGDLFVTYAKQNAEKHDDVAGKGNGFVDVFDTDGQLLRRFATRGALNSPWGATRASFAFGRFSGDILIGNFGDGKINVFDSKGNFRNTLRGTDGKPIVIDGLWTLKLGGGRNSSSDTLYFTAGPNDETDGLFGTISPESTGQTE